MVFWQRPLQGWASLRKGFFEAIVVVIARINPFKYIRETT
jgi:hypothetical protein